MTSSQSKDTKLTQKKKKKKKKKKEEEEKKKEEEEDEEDEEGEEEVVMTAVSMMATRTTTRAMTMKSMSLFIHQKCGICHRKKQPSAAMPHQHIKVK